MNPKIVMGPKQSAPDSARDRLDSPAVLVRCSSRQLVPGCLSCSPPGDLRAVMTNETVPVEQRGTVVDEWRRGMWNEFAPGEKLLTKGEVAQLCRVEIRTVDRWVAAGKIKCYRIPSGRLLFRKTDVLMAADRRDGRVVQNVR